MMFDILFMNNLLNSIPECICRLFLQCKSVVRKAERNGYVTIKSVEEKRTYAVCLTPTGEDVAEKRCAANTETATAILSCLSEEEISQLNAITKKIILSCKNQGAHGARKSGKVVHNRCRH